MKKVIKKKDEKKRATKVADELNEIEEKVEEQVEEKKATKPTTKHIQIKERTFDAETNIQFSNWVSGKKFIVIDETDTTFTFGNDAKIKLGVVNKEDCIVTK